MERLNDASSEKNWRDSTSSQDEGEEGTVISEEQMISLEVAGQSEQSLLKKVIK